MLGLGDIVLPGMMIGLALRFDLYRHYLNKQEKPGQAESGKTTIDTTASKVRYIPPGKYWSSQFWMSSWLGRQHELPASVQTGSFSKTYFWTSVVGYVIGMITTLVVMTSFQHAQPALLYLVPGVLVSLWGMALIKGELKEMWDFTEAEEDIEQKPDQGGKPKSGSYQSIFSNEKSKRNEEKMRRALSKHVQQGDSEPGEETSVQVKSKDKVKRVEDEFRRDRYRDIVYFAVTHHAPSRRSGNGSKSTLNWVDIGENNDDRPGKRQRTT